MAAMMAKTKAGLKSGVRGLAGWSLRGKMTLALLSAVFSAEAAMAYQQIAYAINPCKVENAAAFVTANGGCQDVKTGRVWSRNAKSPERGGSWYTYAGAKNYCANLVEGGYGDWRLPTLSEMQTVSADGAATYLNSFWIAPDGGGTATESDVFKWSITTVKGGKYAYVVKLGSGEVQSSGWSTGGGSWTDAICVR